MSRSLIPISALPQIGKIDEADYFRLYDESLADPDGFWARARQAPRLDQALHQGDERLLRPATSRSNGSRTARSTPAYNCIDRHLATRGDQTAILWEGDDPGEDRNVTYRELHEQVCRLANVLKARGRQEGRPGHDLSCR